MDAFGNAFTTTDLGDWGAVNEGLKAGSLAVAITNNDYITFNVEASSGFTMTLTNLSFVAGRADEAKSATDWAVMSSVDGFTDGDEVGTLLVTGAQQAGDLQSFNFDLTGTGYENIAAGTNVEFRIYMWGASGAKSSSRVQIDNVLLQGTTSVVPEPGTFALLAGLTGLTSAMLRRCRA